MNHHKNELKFFVALLIAIPFGLAVYGIGALILWLFGVL